MPDSAFQPIAGSKVPQPAKRLLVHSRDMTSTLATFHESLLRVEVLQRSREQDLYLREVFLRTLASDAVVEYGVIGIALEHFTDTQQEMILAGTTPLGGVLHHFKISFESAPIRFFSVSADALSHTPMRPATDAMCYGRFNRLTKKTGEPLAWILEILPPLPA